MTVLWIFLPTVIALVVGQECAGLDQYNMDFSAWSRVLESAVIPNILHHHSGIVYSAFNFTKLKNNSDYALFRCQVENAVVGELSEAQYKAFWINVYNFMAVAMCFDHPCKYDMFGYCVPMTSILNIGLQQPSIFPPVSMKMPYLSIANAGNSILLSLDDVEAMLRCPPSPWKEDVRIHAAIVRGSVSSPNLQKTAYTAENIEGNLTDATRDFFKNRKKGVALINNQLWVSHIFEDYPGDFDNQSKPLRTCNGVPSNSFNATWFLQQYAPENIQRWISVNPHQLYFRYFSFDWSLDGAMDHVCTFRRACFPWWIGMFVLMVLVLLFGLVIFIARSAAKREYEMING